MPEKEHTEYYEQGTGKLLKKVSRNLSPEEIAERARVHREEHLLEELDDVKGGLEWLSGAVGALTRRIHELEEREKAREDAGR